MICEKYYNLSPFEKVMFIGELTHACMSDDKLHEKALFIINEAKNKGIFESVKIMPPKNEPPHENE